MGAVRGCREPGGDRRATARLPGEYCPLLSLERAGTSHVLLSPSQVPPPCYPCPPCEGRGWAAPSPISSQPLPADVSGRKRTEPLLRGCSGEVSVPVPSSPRRLAARKGRWGTARGGSHRGAEERSEETPGVRRIWGGEVEAGLVPGVERSVRRESRDTESQEGRES